MRIRASRAFAFIPVWTLAAMVTGCRSAQPSAPAVDSVAAKTASEAEEAQRIADAVLGKQAEILDRGDLAQNGQEQLLIINRFGSGPKNGSTALITRAVVLEKSEGKWQEIFRCDEHLKNPYGYLVAANRAATGWDLVVGDTGGPLEMAFTPAVIGGAADARGGERKEVKNATFVVRWNTKANRYQAYDQSQKRYLRETTGFEMPNSVLK